MQTAMVVTWTHPIPGREAKALEYAAEVARFWGKQAAEGLCSEPEMFFSDRGTSMWIVKGERDVVLRIHDMDEARLLTLKGELLLEEFNVDFFYTGDAAADYMVRFNSALTSIS
ncbi:MAG TPA: hypothetical protein VLS51_06770 [Propionibacteriaceae bacterium]|nr:hypothetical protein [Propionibacteriaceae bacterium]